MSNKFLNDSPASVQRAVFCIWISTGFVVLISFSSLLGVSDIPSSAATLVTDLFTACLLAVVAINVTAGRSWARWLYAVFFVLGLSAFTAWALLAPEAFHAMPMTLKATGFVQFALQGVAFALMLTKSSRQWFGVTTVPVAPQLQRPT